MPMYVKRVIVDFAPGKDGDVVAQTQVIVTEEHDAPWGPVSNDATAVIPDHAAVSYDDAAALYQSVAKQTKAPTVKPTLPDIS